MHSLSVQSTHGQPKPEPGNGAQASLDAFARYLAKKGDTTCTHMVLRGIWSAAVAVARARGPAAPGSSAGTSTGGCECVREDTFHVGGCDATAMVADA